MHRSLKTLEAVLESMDVGIMIADMQGNLLTMNSAALKMHCFSSTADMLPHHDQF